MGNVINTERKKNRENLKIYVLNLNMFCIYKQFYRNVLSQLGKGTGGHFCMGDLQIRFMEYVAYTFTFDQNARYEILLVLMVLFGPISSS